MLDPSLRLAAIVLSTVAWLALTLLLAHRLDAATPEEASYLINMSNGDGGSATFVHPYIAITNWHVAGRIGSRGILKHQFGAQVAGQVVCSDENADVALVVVQQPQPFISLAERGPQRGEQLKLCGYCAPQRILKSGVGTVSGGYSSMGRGVPTNITSVVSISGDSGGGMFNEKGELAAINWGRDNSGSSLSTSVEYIKAVGERWATTNLPQERWQEVQCFGGRCQPYGGGGQQQYGGGGGYGVQPKLPVTQPPQQLQPVPPPLAQQPLAPRPAPATPIPPADYAAPKCEPVDTDKLASTLLEKLAKDERFKGPKGDKGEPGKDAGACECDEDKIAAAVLAKIDYAKIAAFVTVPQTSASSEVHYVVVGEESGGYWPRLQQQVRYATERFAGITTSTPPKNYVGPMPVVVKYTNGVPQYIARGQYEVEQALARLAQGKIL